ncbi:hypothetical protein E2C01_048774 [Portunus trituberculatus]|uniref:Uncharacterized protein n=1 Tax=Portunus trituberculatus TaxID=210409 RepID=A0A5B7GBY7_PORTR|nr:hypothetical protein [Portunus trituberculatus]
MQQQMEMLLQNENIPQKPKRLRRSVLDTHMLCTKNSSCAIYKNKVHVQAFLDLPRVGVSINSSNLQPMHLFIFLLCDAKVEDKSWSMGCERLALAVTHCHQQWQTGTGCGRLA